MKRILHNHLFLSQWQRGQPRLLALKQDDVLHMLGMGEHIHGLHTNHTVLSIKKLQITCLGGRVAAYIDNAVGIGKQNRVYHILMHTGTWRVGYDDIGAAMLLYELPVQDILHVAGIEKSVAYTVQFRVHLGILYRFGHILYANHLTRLLSHEVGYGAGASIEVVDKFAASQSGKLACYLI